MLNGRVQVQRVPGEGSAFTVLLPSQKANPGSMLL